MKNLKILFSKINNIFKYIIKDFFIKNKKIKKNSENEDNSNESTEKSSFGCLIAILIFIGLCLFPVGRAILAILFLILLGCLI